MLSYDPQGYLSRGTGSPARLLVARISEIAQHAVLISPFPHFYKTLEEYLAVQQLLHVVPGGRGNFFQHGPLLSDDDALVAGLLTENGHADAHQLLPLRLIEGLHLHGDAVSWR